MGTKSDLVIQREVSFEEALSLAKREGLNYIEISSKEKRGVNQLT